MVSLLKEHLIRVQPGPDTHLSFLLGEHQPKKDYDTLPTFFSDAVWGSLEVLFPNGLYLTGSVAQENGQFKDHPPTQYLLHYLLHSPSYPPSTPAGFFAHSFLNSICGSNTDLTGVVADNTDPNIALEHLSHILSLTNACLPSLYPADLSYGHYPGRQFPQVTIIQPDLSTTNFRVFTSDQWQPDRNPWCHITNLRRSQIRQLSRQEGQIYTQPLYPQLLPIDTVSMLTHPPNHGSWCQFTARTIRSLVVENLNHPINSKSFLNHLPASSTVSTENLIATIAELYIAFITNPTKTIDLIHSSELLSRLPNFNASTVSIWAQAINTIDHGPETLSRLLAQPDLPNTSLTQILAAAQSELFSGPLQQTDSDWPNSHFFTNLAQLSPLLGNFSILPLSQLTPLLPISNVCQLHPLPSHFQPPDTDTAIKHNQLIIEQGLKSFRVLLPPNHPSLNQTSQYARDLLDQNK